jgi:hypothetical protein
MKTWSWFAAILLLALGACEDASPSDRASVIDGELGSLEMSLIGVDADNQRYRLRGAAFEIAGTEHFTFQPVSQTLLADDHLDDAVLRSELVYGYYTVSLHPESWYVERVTPEGPQRVEEAVLLSPLMQHVSIQPSSVSQLGFQFGVDGDIVDFFGGRLEIGVGFQRPPQPDAGGE